VLKRVESKTRRHRSLELSVQAHFLTLYFEQHPDKKYRGHVLTVNRDGEVLVLIVDLGVEAVAHTSRPVRPGHCAMWKPDVSDITGTVQWQQVD
jgi:hypothetical protein